MPRVTKPKCGMCGKRRQKIKLTKTECCNNWICDDEHTYRLFSFGLNSCSRNHRRYSQCAFHFNEKHEGKWQDCKQCEEIGFDDGYEFTELENPDLNSVKCLNCDFVADTLDAFPCETRQGYYCSKKECLNKGRAQKRKATAARNANKPKCGLCHKLRKNVRVTKTGCCDNWICDDEHLYPRYDSCSRNHRRYTVCAFHSNEGHEGKWRECEKCKAEFPDGEFTDEYQFELMTCVNCSFTADTMDDFPLKTRKGYYCIKEECQKAGLPKGTKRKLPIKTTKPKMPKTTKPRRPAKPRMPKMNLFSLFPFL